MNTQELLSTLRLKKGNYLLWLGSLMGGLILSYMAAMTILVLHRHTGGLFPKREAYLLTGVISLLITGLSYINNKKRNPSFELSPILSIIWGFFLLLVYGGLIAVGVSKPAISEKSILWIAVGLFICCMLWSSVIWLHEQGVESESTKIAEAPEVAKDLIDAAKELSESEEKEDV